MADYAWVETLKITSFSNNALLQLTRFSRRLKQLTGRELSLRDPKLAKHLIQEIKRTRDSELRTLFKSLLPEFHAMAEGKEFNGPARSQASKEIPKRRRAG